MTGHNCTPQNFLNELKAARNGIMFSPCISQGRGHVITGVSGNLEVCPLFGKGQEAGRCFQDGGSRVSRKVGLCSTWSLTACWCWM